MLTTEKEIGAMIADSLAQSRREAGLTQTQVGDYIGVSAQAVSKWENGLSEPDIETLYRLAELYKVTVDELVGKNSEVTKDKKKSIFERIKEMLILHKRKAIAAGAILLVTITALIILLISCAGGAKVSYEDYSKIELGMTMDEVKKTLGKPHEELAKYTDDDMSIGLATATYGYCNVDIWYYRSEEYNDNEKAANELDFDYEFKTYEQIRIVFNEDGKVIEAYYNPVCEYDTLFDDYGGGDDKEMTSIEYLDGEHKKTETKEQVRMIFEDGSDYLGEVKIYNKKIEHRWGTFAID